MDMDVDWIRSLLPDVDAQVAAFTVETDEMDEELISVFIDEVQRLSDQLVQGLDLNDRELVRLAAHSIKGMGGTMGLPELSVLALEIENHAKRGELAPSAPLVHGLTAWAARLR